MSSAPVDILIKTIFHAITESKYWELSHEILSFFKLSTEAQINCLTGQQLINSGVC